MNKTDKKQHPNTPENEALTTYPKSEDIYNKLKKESDIDPENISKKKTTETESASKRNAKDFNEDKSGADLDIPGSELDDQQERIGSEDEENNSYSIGGDDHNDLEEDNA